MLSIHSDVNIRSLNWEENYEDSSSSSTSFRFVGRLRASIFRNSCLQPCRKMSSETEFYLDDSMFQNEQQEPCLLSDRLSQLTIPSPFLGSIAEEIASFYRTTATVRNRGIGYSMVAEVDWAVWVRESTSGHVNRQANRLVPAAKSVIEGLEKMKKGGCGCEQGKCMICLEELDAVAGNKEEEEEEEEEVEEGKEEFSALPCSHVFHSGCITQWLQTSHLCPLCRYEMAVDEEEEIGYDDDDVDNDEEEEIGYDDDDVEDDDEEEIRYNDGDDYDYDFYY